MGLFEVLLLLLLASAGLALLARRLHIPYAVALILAGMGLALVPGLPAVELDPTLALILFLPPFLQLSAQRTDWQAFRGELKPILLLAVGAVLFTAAAVGAVAKLLVPELPWGAAIALGAIVAPPDAVAAAAVLRETSIAKRIVTVLEGESLLNDASSLVLYRFAVAATAAGSVSLGDATWSFALSAAGGTAIGLGVGRVVVVLLAKLEDGLIETAFTILAGYGAYIAAEHLHVSGVLAAVGSGLVIGRAQHRVLSARVRLQSTAIWEFVEFLLTSFVFILIGLQLRGLLARLQGEDPTRLAGVAVAVSAALIASRFVWVYATGGLPGAGPRSAGDRPRAPRSHLAVISWAGMRGVVSLAAALALPAAFPERDLIVFLAFCAILATLVLQGTTLGLVIRWLRVQEPHAGMLERETALRRKLAAAELDALVSGVGRADRREVVLRLLPEYRERVLATTRLERDGEPEAHRRAERIGVRLRALAAARRLLDEHQTVLDMERLRAIEEELDHREAQLRRSLDD